MNNEEIEGLITRIEDGELGAIDEAEDLMNHASSDDWKDKFCDSLFALTEAVGDKKC